MSSVNYSAGWHEPAINIDFLSGSTILIYVNLILSVFVLFSSSVNAFAQIVDPEFGKVISTCQVKNAHKHVWIFKQWHASPSVDTSHATTGPELPQKKNQTAIYQQLERWVLNETLNTFISEGCSGKIDPQFKSKFNGWGFEDLKAKSTSTDYRDIVTLIPLKLAAKFGDKVAAVCGDDESLLKQQGLAFSDARGDLGFLTRINQLKDQKEKLKSYVETAAELQHLPKTATADIVVKSLMNDLKESIKKIRSELGFRNEKFLETIKSIQAKDMALVIGGIHAKDLSQLLVKEEIGCTIVEPVGYNQNEEQLLADITAFGSPAEPNIGNRSQPKALR